VKTIILSDMNKILNATASASLSTSSYEAPTTELVGATTEGVLCTSGQLEEWEEDSINWQQFNY
jgi:hypothetical protein